MKQIMLMITVFTMVVLVGCTMEVKTEDNESQNYIEDTKKEQNTGNEMSVHFIDVGQGDSILIQSPDGKNMLIDGGTREAGKQVVTYLKEQGIKKLDYVVATHPDADHIGGLIKVIDSLPINKFVDSGKVHTSRTYEEMLQLIIDKKIPFIVPSNGDTIPLDPLIEIDVLNAGGESVDNNEASIVLKVTYKEVSFLLTGDAGISVEQDMLRKSGIKSTILKAGHHGSDTSSSEDFIRNVEPKVTILSYGQDNSYGHPHDEVMNRLEKVSSEVYATAQVGNIVVITDGIDYKVITQSQEVDMKPETNVDATSIVISSKDLEEEVIGITNMGHTDVNLKDWQLVSVEGNQVFEFPTFDLSAGKTIYITSGPDAKEGQDYLKWNNRQIWKNDGDAASLKNEKGEVVSELE